MGKSSGVLNGVSPFFSQVSEQVLTEHVLQIINELVQNFIKIVSSFTLTRINPIRHLNGDLRALVLVTTSKRDHVSPRLLKALELLKSKVVSLLESLAKDNQEPDSPGKASGPDVTQTSTTSPAPLAATPSDGEEAPISTAKKRLFDDFEPDAEPSKRRKISTDEQEPSTSSAASVVIPEKTDKFKETLNRFLKTLNMLYELCEAALNDENSQNEIDQQDEAKEDTS